MASLFYDVSGNFHGPVFSRDRERQTPGHSGAWRSPAKKTDRKEDF